VSICQALFRARVSLFFDRATPFDYPLTPGSFGRCSDAPSNPDDVQLTARRVTGSARARFRPHVAACARFPAIHRSLF